MVINFAEAQAKQLHRRLHKVKTARALEEAYKLLKPYRTLPEVAQVCMKLRDAAQRLGPF